METINIQFQVPSTGQYTLDEFVAKLKDYADKLASSISKSGNSYQERYMSQAEQEAYVAESLNRALDEMEAHKKNGTKPMDARDLLRKLRQEFIWGEEIYKIPLIYNKEVGAQSQNFKKDNNNCWNIAGDRRKDYE